MTRVGERRRCGRSVTDTASARRFVTELLPRYGAPDEVVQTLRLAASELVSNALVARRSSAEITVEAGSDGWGLEVLGGCQPAGHLLWDTSRWRIHGDERSSGRGLGVVRALVDEVEVHRVDDQALVSCWIRGKGLVGL